MHQDNSHLGGSDDKARLESVLRGDFSVLCSYSCPRHNTTATRKYLSFCRKVVTTWAKRQQKPKLSNTRNKNRLPGLIMLAPLQKTRYTMSKNL